jgi:chitinase
MLRSSVSTFGKTAIDTADWVLRDKTTGKGVCGLGPDFCGDGCISTCYYKSECDPGWGMQWSNASTCPVNVCCSKFGFCGTTKDFCNGVVTPSPECSTKTADEKLIGYYEGWNLQRPCGRKCSWIPYFPPDTD